MTTGWFQVYVALMVIELAAWIGIVRYRHNRKYPKYIADPPWPTEQRKST